MSTEKTQLVNELHQSARKNFPRRRVIIRGYDDLWQADLVDMRAYSHINSGYQYILTVIDTFSKYVWAEPLKSKSGKDVVNAFHKITSSGIGKMQYRKPRNLQTDDGKEFYNKDFQTFTNKNEINHYSTYSVMKASIVERLNRTLKNNMWKRFTLNGNYKWIKILPQLIDNYNRRLHRTIGMRPIDVTPKHTKKLLSTVYSNIKIAAPAKYKINDYVRISKYKNLFAKGYTPNWTTEIFQIARIQRTNPVTYLLRDINGEDIKGGFYEHELLLTKQHNVYLVEKVLRKKGAKVYVKWLGMDKSHNSWIDKKNIL